MVYFYLPLSTAIPIHKLVARQLFATTMTALILLISIVSVQSFMIRLELC